MIRVPSRCLLITCLVLALFVVPSAAQQEEVVEAAKEMVMDKAKEMAMEKADEMAGETEEIPAQATASFEECPGPVATWRDNELAEGGSHEGFLEATRDHLAWLESKGHTEVQIRTWVAFDPGDGGPLNQDSSPQQVGFGSEVVYPSFAYANEVYSKRESDRDEAYEAFVAKYRANTVVKTTLLVCLSE